MMDELIADFLAETTEGLQNLDNELVELEQHPEDAALLGSIFRIMHTIKGTSGFLGLDKLGAIAHAGENIMDKIRNKQLAVSQSNISIILEAIDTIKYIVSYININEKEPDDDYTSLINMINDAAIGNSVADTVAKTIAPIPETQTLSVDLINNQPTQESNLNMADKAQPIQTIRVNVDVLENLMQIVSELVLNRNQLIQLNRTYHDNKFASPIQRLNLITSSLQETVMETRMQPIGNAWIKIPRMVRDLSKELNKKIKLVMIGEDTELDRQLIESIKDPLTHMIRNSADHGIELPEERLKAGKNESGTITLKAYHQGGHIIIQISDDGQGLDIKRIRKKIVQKGMASEAAVKEMSSDQIIQYIFKAGFSTSEVITEVSGRGVGMDVVRNNIENIRGTVSIESIEGKGITFTIKIPLTLAIMPILVVEAANQKFGLPQINIIEMVRTDNNSEYVIEQINDYKVLRLRDILLPLVTLSEMLKISSNKDVNNKKNQFVVVCEANGENFGLIIDRIYDTEEIVLKPAPKLIRSIGVYSGNTLLGNGDVIMIIDPSYIVKYLTDNNHTKSALTEHIDEKNIVSHKTSSFLIVKSAKASKAIPLELVARLEEIDVNNIEFTEDKRVVQYRGSLMYLVNLDPKYKIPEQGIQQVVVFINKDHILGLVVEEILDIIEQDIDSTSIFEDTGLTALVLNGKTMDVVDVNKFFNQVFSSNYSAKRKNKNSKEGNSKYNILLIDDSNFFLKFFTPILKKEGFNVEAINSSIEALNMLEKQKFDLIVTDINMPKMDGFTFANTCNNDPRFKDIPIIAFTANYDIAANQAKISSNSIKACISKTSQNELIETIYSLLDGQGN